MSDVRMISDYGEQKRLIEPILVSMGKKLPCIQIEGKEPEACAIYFAEFNQAGELIAFQGLQNAIFFEGLWAKSCKCHLRTVWNKALQWVREHSGEGAEVYTFAADDKVAGAAVAMKCELLPWKVLRRKV